MAISFKHARDTNNYDFRRSGTMTDLLIVKAQNTFSMYAMTILADSAYLNGDYSKVYRNSYYKMDTSFTGAVLFHRMDGSFVNGWRYQNGIVTRQLSVAPAGSTVIQSDGKQQIDVTSSPCSTVEVTTFWEDCSYYEDDLTYSNPFNCFIYTTTQDYVDCSESETGSGGSPLPPCQVSGTGSSSGSGSSSGPGGQSSASIQGKLIIDVTTGGGNGSGGTTNPPPLIPCQTNNNSTPNKVNSVLKVKDDTLGQRYPCAVILILNKLLALQSYNSLVAPFETNQKPDLIFSTNDFTWNPTNGSSALAYTQVDPNSGVGLGALVQLNNNMLQNSSMLLIEAAFVHETFHAYINYDVTLAHLNGTPNFRFNGSWMNELDFFIDQNGLPSNYRDHYEMMTDYFDQAISILAALDNNAHSTQQYAMAMLYGMNNAGDSSTPDERNRLTTEYNDLMASYGITPDQINTYWMSQLTANASDRLPTNCNSQ